MGSIGAAPKLFGGVALGLCVSAAGCILPDDQIDVITQGENNAPVRLIEPPPLTLEARCACAAALNRDDCPDDVDPSEWEPQCPLPEASGLPHFLDDSNPAYQFCRCAPDERDARRLNDVLLFAEDQDEVDGNPTDELYAVLLLDMPEGGLVDAQDYVAYTTLRDPTRPLDRSPGSLYDRGPILRPAPYVRRIFVGDADGKIDLCNSAGPGFSDLAPGWHTITLLVTDRPWFTIDIFDDDGELLETQTQIGIPDVRAGATWDTDRYTFRCETQETEVYPCQCEPDQ